MHLEFTTLDVFTNTPYIGNPLAVVRVPASVRNLLTEDKKQKIAREFNLSETTFIHEPAKGANTADFDIFTPKSRMTFAGHPTIGTTIYVAQHPNSYPGIKQLHTIAGTIPFKYDHTLERATVSVPHDVYTHRHRFSSPLGEKNSVPIVSIVKGMAFGLCRLPDLEALGRMNAPLLPPEDRYKAALLDADSGWDIGLTGSFYFVDLGNDPDDKELRLLRTRCIPQHEDPGTGSASAALCSYLALADGVKGTQKFHLVQGVEMGRRCDIFVDVKMKNNGDGIEDVKLSGVAVEIMRGSLTID